MLPSGKYVRTIFLQLFHFKAFAIGNRPTNLYCLWLFFCLELLIVPFLCKKPDSCIWKSSNVILMSKIILVEAFLYSVIHNLVPPCMVGRGWGYFSVMSPRYSWYKLHWLETIFFHLIYFHRFKDTVWWNRLWLSVLWWVVAVEQHCQQKQRQTWKWVRTLVLSKPQPNLNTTFWFYAKMTLHHHPPPLDKLNVSNISAVTDLILIKL